MDTFNVNGWTPIHESCYKGNYATLSRFIKFALEMKKDVLELKTMDTLKVTPLLLCALNGQLECMKFLINVGANIEAKFINKNHSEHGLVEIAVIRQDIKVLSFLYDIMPNIELRIRDLMISEDNDENTLASIGRCLEILTKPNLTGNENLIKNELINHPEFSKCFSTFLKLCTYSEEAFVSCVLIMENIFEYEKIRDDFSKYDGINNLIQIIDMQKQSLKEQIKIYEAIIEKNQISSTQTNSSSNKPSKRNCFTLMHASIGQALYEISKHETFLDFIIAEAYGELIFYFVKLLFELNDLDKHYKIIIKNRTSSKSSEVISNAIIFEEFIKPYLDSMSNLAYKNVEHKALFYQFNLYEVLISYWFKLQYSLVNSRKRNRSPLNHHISIRDIISDDSIESSIQFDSSVENLNDSLTMTRNKFYYETDNLAPRLINLLKFKLVDCIGKIMCNNVNLKKKYLYFKHESKSNTKNNLYYMTNTLITNLIKSLDPVKLVDKQVRLNVLKFLSFICENDKKAMNSLIPFKEADTSILVQHLRELLRKDFPLDLREDVIETIWNLCGGINDYSFFHTQNEKWLLHKSIGVRKYLISLFESELLCMYSLKALKAIACGPPYKHPKTSKIIRSVYEDIFIDTIPLVVRVLTIKNEEILLSALELIESICVSAGFVNNYKNQLCFIKMGVLENLLSLISKSNIISPKLSHEVYYCFSMLSLNNSVVKEVIYSQIPRGVSALTENILLMLIGDFDGEIEKNEDSKEETDFDLDKWHIVENRILAGKTLCAFCYHDEWFSNYIVETYNKIMWKIFDDLLIKVKIFENNAKNEYHSLITQKAKCYLALQIGSLYNIINTSDEDPRACGINMLLHLLQYSSNSYVRAIASECVCCLAKSDRTLIEPMISIDAIEILCGCLDLNKSPNICEVEIANASIALATLTNLCAEARRRILRLARISSLIMETLQYYNEKLNTDLISQWDHCEKLLNIVKKPYKFSIGMSKNLPSIPSKSSRKNS